jgi:quercetin 2,3-dioxygenase
MLKFSDGDHITVKTENNPVRFMLMAGAPFKEPIVPYGPFVMNTIEEIQQTLKELRNGTFIKIIKVARRYNPAFGYSTN